VLKTLQAVGIACKSVRQNLNRDIARQAGVACAMDFSHTARAPSGD
jgi:hypothetical protein